MIDTHRLRVFRSVASTGSLRAAAETLGYTPSAVSQHLATLQRETGLTLMEKHGRGVRLTPHGVALAHRADSVLAALDALEDYTAELRAGHTGHVVFGYLASASTGWVPRITSAFQDAFPDAQLTLRLIDLSSQRPFTPDVEVYVESHPSGGLEGYDIEVLRDEDYRLVVPTGHHLAGQQGAHLGDLLDECWVESDPSPCNTAPREAFDAVGRHPTPRVVAPDYPTAAAFVASGAGITLMPEVATAHLPAGCEVVTVGRPTPRRRIMLRTRRATLTPATEGLAEITRRIVSPPQPAATGPDAPAP